MLKHLLQWGQPLWVLLLWVGLQIPPVTRGIKTLAQTYSTVPICPSAVAIEIEKIIHRPEFVRSHWGILIQPLHSDLNLYALNADQYFVPASNIKLLTSAAALLEFGSQFRIRTPIYTQGVPPDLKTLRLVGQGDPTLTTQNLIDLAQQLKRQGIKRIEQLIIQDGYFPDEGIPLKWEWDDLFFSYGVPANSLVLNENAFDLILTPGQLGQPLQLVGSDPLAAQQWQIENLTTTTSSTENSINIRGVFGQSRLVIQGQLGLQSQPDVESIAILDPAQYFLETLKKVLEAEGIIVNQGHIITQKENNSLENPLIILESPPLEFILQKVNQDSHNLFAQTLLKLLEDRTTGEQKISNLQQRLSQLGIDANGYRMVDGSGLSRHNLATPATFVALLQKMSQTPQGNVYRNSLAVAGINGTLANRFKNTPMQGRLQAKTGTLSGISALSGYLEIANGETLVFSIMVNLSEQTSTNLRQGIDEIVLVLGRLKKCS